MQLAYFEDISFLQKQFNYGMFWDVTALPSLLGIIFFYINLYTGTFFQGRFFIFLKSLDSDGFEPNSGRRILLQNVPHILLAEHEQVRIPDGTHRRCPTVACRRVIHTLRANRCSVSYNYDPLYLTRYYSIYSHSKQIVICQKSEHHGEVNIMNTVLKQTGAV